MQPQYCAPGSPFPAPSGVLSCCFIGDSNQITLARHITQRAKIIIHWICDKCDRPNSTPRGLNNADEPINQPACLHFQTNMANMGQDRTEPGRIEAVKNLLQKDIIWYGLKGPEMTMTDPVSASVCESVVAVWLKTHYLKIIYDYKCDFKCSPQLDFFSSLFGGDNINVFDLWRLYYFYGMSLASLANVSAPGSSIMRRRGCGSSATLLMMAMTMIDDWPVFVAPIFRVTIAGESSSGPDHTHWQASAMCNYLRRITTAGGVVLKWNCHIDWCAQ